MLGINSAPITGGRTRESRRAIRAVLLAILVCLAVGVIAPTSGCGSGGGTKTPATNPTRGGVISLNFPTLAQETSRLLPGAGRYIRIQFNDAGPGGSLVPLPLYDRDGNRVRVQDASGNVVSGVNAPLYDIVDRTGDSGSRTYGYLPLKNLILRVTAHRENPYTNPDETTNPPLARAEVSVVPVARDLDGTGGKALTFTLATTVTALEITGPDIAESDATAGDAVTRQYRLSARVGDAIALVGGNVLTADKVRWTPSAITADGKVASENNPADVTVPDGSEGHKGLEYSIKFLGVRERIFRLSVRDVETELVATREIRLRPKSSGADLTVSNPPFGTRSVKIVVENVQNPQANQTIVAPWTTGATLKEFTRDTPFAPGTTTFKIESYATEDGTGEPLSETGSVTKSLLPGWFDTRPNRPTDEVAPDYFADIALPTPEEGKLYPSVVRVYVLSGRTFKSNEGVGLQSIAEPQPVTNLQPGFAGGQEYVLEVRQVKRHPDGITYDFNSAVALPAAWYTLTPSPVNGLLEPLGDVSGTRWRFRVNSVTLPARGSALDTAFSLVLKGAGRETTYTENALTVQADLGGVKPITVN